MSKFSLQEVKSKLLSRRIKRWIQDVSRADLQEVRRRRKGARQLKAELGQVIRAADGRLAQETSAKLPKPHNADWAWRPEVWSTSLEQPGLSSVKNKSMMGAEITLFHDCAQSEITLRQVKNLRAKDMAPFGVCLDVFEFSGSFLSLALDLPKASAEALKRSHIIQMDAIVELERPIEIFARLNVKHGPNTEKIVRELPLDANNHMVEFDLAYSNLNEKRVERAWVDLIFEGPQMNQVILRNLSFSRRPRAPL